MDSRRQKENDRQRQRRKKRHERRVRSKHEKEMDQQLSILPGTWEGEVSEKKHEMYDIVVPPASPAGRAHAARGWCLLM